MEPLPYDNFFMTHRAAISKIPVGKTACAMSSSQASFPHRYRAWGWVALAARKMVLATSRGLESHFFPYKWWMPAAIFAAALA